MIQGIMGPNMMFKGTLIRPRPAPKNLKACIPPLVFVAPAPMKQRMGAKKKHKWAMVQ
jgi:hypothetical protein